MSKKEITAKVYNILSEALFEHGLTIKDILNVCGEVINNNLQSSSEREQRLSHALWESFNVPKISFTRQKIFSYAPAVVIVFREGITVHSQYQKQNFKAYMEFFSNLNDSDKDFLIKEYPRLGILFSEDKWKI